MAPSAGAYTAPEVPEIAFGTHRFRPSQLVHGTAAMRRHAPPISLRFETSR